MHLGSNNFKHNYTMRDTQLQNESQEKDLGVIIKDNLKVDAQCAAAAKKANRVLGTINRTFQYKDRKIKAG